MIFRNIQTELVDFDTKWALAFEFHNEQGERCRQAVLLPIAEDSRIVAAGLRALADWIECQEPEE